MQAQKKVRILTFDGQIGGTHAFDLDGQGAVNANGGHWYTDVAFELANIQKIRPYGDTLFIKVGGGAVIQIAEEATEIDARFELARKLLAEERASTAHGLAQRPTIGAMAATIALRRDNLQATFASQLVRPALSRYAGNADYAQNIIKGSLGGGTGAGGFAYVGQALTNALIAEGEFEIDEIYFFAGAMTYDIHGQENIKRNVGVSLLRLLAIIMDPKAPLQVNRIAWLSELPMVGDRFEERHLLAALQSQAVFCTDVQTRINLRLSNDSMPSEVTGRYGRIYTFRNDFWAVTHSSRIQAGAANAYLTPIRNLKQTPLSTEGLTDQLSPTEEPVEEEWPDQALVDQAADCIADADLPTKLDPIGPKFKVTYIVNDQDPISAITGEPKTFDAYADAIAHARGTLEMVKVKSGDLETERDQINAELPRMKRDVLNAYRLAIAKGFIAEVFAYLLSGGKDKPSRDQEFADQLADYRAQRRNLMRIEAEINHLQNLSEQIARIIELSLISQLDRIEQAMEAAMEDGSSLSNLRFKPLAEVFPELITIKDPAQIRHFLGANTLRSVPMPALARMLNLDQSDPAAIIAKVESGEPDYEGPWFGGHPRADKGRVFLVFPPMEPDDQTLLRQAASKDVTVCFQDRTAAGLGVIRLEVYWTAKLADVVTRMYANAAKAALASEYEPLIHVPGDTLLPLERVEEELKAKKTNGEVQDTEQKKEEGGTS